MNLGANDHLLTPPHEQVVFIRLIRFTSSSPLRTHSRLGAILLCSDWFAGPEEENRLAGRSGDCWSFQNKTRTHKLCWPDWLSICPVNDLCLTDTEQGKKNNESNTFCAAREMLHLKMSFTSMMPLAECWKKISRTPSSLKCPRDGWLWREINILS